jgi:predicted nucleic acid-binding protein
MVVVDTSIWIEFLQNKDSEAAIILTALIKPRNKVVLCGIVLQEILQGIRSSKSYENTRDTLLKFPFIGTDRETWLLAASLYRKLRANGVTLPSVDVTIAAIAIRNRLPLLTRDKHFLTVEQHSELELYRS